MRTILSILFAGAIVAHAAESDFLLTWRGERFDLATQNDLVRLRDIATALSGEPSEKTRRGAKEIQALATAALAASNEVSSPRDIVLLREVAAALENNRRPPAPAHVDLLLLPFYHYHYARARVGLGTAPAANVPLAATAHDAGHDDPADSTFWTRPTNIVAANLRAGFGRAAPPVFEDAVWTYAAPKTSYGGHAGCEVRDGTRRLKIKFGELHSEPFTARIFSALGYNVEPTDYSPGLKIHYDRRLFTEFNSRKPVNTRLTLFWLVPLCTLHFQPKHDPFNFIRMAVLKDGTALSGAALRSFLIASRRGKHHGDIAWNESAEAQISYLVTGAANVQLKEPQARSIGPWDFGQLGHERRRELRGAGLLAAWVGWADSRFDNTRLKLVRADDATELKHFFTDLGGGLGRANGLIAYRPEDVEAFPDHFTEPEVRQGPGRMTIPFRIVNFQPVERTRAFEEMTIDDARWMARLIRQLSPEQIEEALEASGFDARQVHQVAGKLIARRAKMLADLGLPPAAK